MKKSAIILSASALAVFAVGPVGLLCLSAFLFTSSQAPVVHGVSMVEINATTLAQLVAQTSAVQEQLWIANIVTGSNASYEDTPFADGMTGRMMAGEQIDDSKIRKAVVEIVDTRKTRGQVVNIPTMAGIGGEGWNQTAGGQRQGTEAPLIVGNFTVTIGKQFYAVGVKQTSIDESVIQDTWAKNINVGLQQLHNRKKSDTIVMSMVNTALNLDGNHAGGAQNYVLPVGVSTRDGLKSANVVDTPTIIQCGEILPGFGAMPMDTTQDSGGSLGELFMFMSTDLGLQNLGTEPALQALLANGWVRDNGKGDKNPVFRGGFVPVQGHGVYRWIHRDHANAYRLGNPLLPRAKLSVALNNPGAGGFIQGGGTAAAALPSGVTGAFETTIQWFQFFSNAPFSGYGGIGNINASTGTTRYLAIINPTGTYTYYSYTVNNGNKITIGAVYTNGGALGNTAAGVHPIGSLIVETNAIGTPFCRSLMFGAQAVAAGIGSINGNPANPEMGKRTMSKLDYEEDIGVGVDGVWGCAPVQRAGDNAYPGFLLLETAYSVPGLPAVV